MAKKPKPGSDDLTPRGEDATVALPHVEESAAADAETTALPATEVAAVAAANTEAPSEAPSPAVEWAPAAPKRKRRWPWLLAPAALIVGGVVFTSSILIAPGVNAAGVPVGGLTRDGAIRAIEDKLATTSVTIDAAGGPVTLTGAQLGASIDATKLANEAYGDHPLWNLGAWGEQHVAGNIVLDQEKALAALRTAVPGDFVDPTEATVTLTDGKFVVAPSADGSGIDVETVRDALEKALTAGESTATVSGDPVVVPPVLTTDEATAAATKLNGVVDTMGFYVGDERTVPVDAKTAASWLTYKIADDGTVSITADEAAIAKVVPSLAAAVNREAVNGTDIVDSEGTVLEEGVKSVQGRKLGDTSKVAAQFAAQLANGNGKFELPVTVVEPTATKLYRHIELNLSEQKVYVWENDKVVNTFWTSTGLPGHDTQTGNFRVRAHVSIQDMGCVDGFDYCTKDVPWVLYFNGDEAFHGTWWHSNFGTPMSHGCANLSIPDAKWLYDWTPQGTEVWVHY